MNRGAFIFSLFLFWTTALFSQEKVEIERRIEMAEVPEAAIEWFEDAYEDARRVRWYLEEGSGGPGYEAKLRWKGGRHSVEFDSTGRIEDIEIIISMRDIPSPTRKKLTQYFENQYDRYRIHKVQRQWIGESDDLEDFIDEDEYDEVENRYEIEFYGKTGSRKNLWEALFDAGGDLIRVREIKLRPTDNLNF
jgi:hypothetical protein